MGAQKLLRTTDRGQTWEEISPDLSKRLRQQEMSVGDGFSRDAIAVGRNDGASAYGNITTISESPKARGTIYVGTDDGNVQMTRDGGKNGRTSRRAFAARAALREQGHGVETRCARRVCRLRRPLGRRHDAVSLQDDGRRHDVDVDGVGHSCRKAGRTLEEDPRDPNLLFAGTELGLYWSNDGGAHWSAGPGNVPALRIDRVLINPRTNDLILGTHARGVLILEDISPLRSASSDVVLHPLRAATLVQTYRDLPWPGGDEFVAPNSPIGTYVSYTVRADAPSRDSVRIQVIGADGAIVTEMSGPDTRGTHRVLWDLRQRLPYVPPASDSGFYGPPRAPYVAPGEYTVKLIARGREQTQTV